MGNIGGGEILIILLVALIFLGPEKMPEVARQVGKVVGEIRKMSNAFQNEIQSAMSAPDEKTPSAPDEKTPSAPDEKTPSDAAAPTVASLAVENPAAEFVADEAVRAAGGESVEGQGVAAPIDIATTADNQAITGVIDQVVTPPEAPPLPTDLAHGGDR